MFARKYIFIILYGAVEYNSSWKKLLWQSLNLGCVQDPFL